jgi:ketosteroid isomerase-like protein
MRWGTPEQNVELHRRALDAFNAHDVEAFLAFADPGVEYHAVLAAVSGTTVYHGHEGVRAWFKDFEDVWDDQVRAEPEVYFAVGERTLLLYRLRARGRQSGAEVTMQFAQVATWRDGLAVEVKIYTDRKEALRELGVSDDALKPIAP